MKSKHEEIPDERKKIIDDLGEWLCRDMAKSANRAELYTEFSRAYEVIRDVADRIKFYRENCLGDVSEGYKLVPIAPTRHMVDTTSKALMGDIGGYEAGHILKMWELMIAAAPQPKETGE